MTDAFSKRHPLVNFVFFAGAIGFGVVIQHPAYLAASILCGAVYWLLLKGSAGLKTMLGMLPLALIITLVNPLFNTYGQTVLFTLFGRPFTLEALLNGAAVAAVFIVMLLWFGCYNLVLTSDKFTSLFGNLIPALSLLLVMVLRMIPNLMRKAAQFLSARKSIGKGGSETDPWSRRVLDGMTILSALTDWALEGSIVTGDSMRSRGYGTAKRTSFAVYRLTALDVGLLLLQLGLLGCVLHTALTGGTDAAYTPTLQIAPVTGTYAPGLAAYVCYLLIPTILHGKEVLAWHISRSKI